MKALRDEALRICREHGLDRYADDVAGGLVPAVRMLPGSGAAEPGSSKFGGLPDLPASTEWPRHDDRPLHFLAQVRLADLPARFVPAAELPRRGLLSFWFDTQAFRGGSDVSVTDPECYRVVLVTGRLSARAFPEHDQRDAEWVELFEPFPERPMAFERRMVLHEDAEASLSDRVCAKAPDVTESLLSALRGGHRAHQLLGGRLLVGGDAREFAASHANGFDLYQQTAEQCERVAREKGDWRLLALFESDKQLGWMWSDMGSLSFWSHGDDLATQRFDRVFGAMD